MERWVGKVAVVTGASMGIGTSIAIALADAGMIVVGLARRPHLIEELNKQVKKCKGKIHGKKCDITVTEDIIKTFAAINEEFGGISVLVNNAGSLEIGSFTDIGEKVVSDEAIERVLKTNTLGLITCTREAVKYMKKTGEQGHVVNISSTAGHYIMAALGTPRHNIYYGSKFALRATSEVLRLEFSYSDANVKITSISPAGVRTEMAAAATSKELADVNNDSPHEAAIPINLLETSDIADAVISVIATPPRVNITELIIRPMGDKF